MLIGIIFSTILFVIYAFLTLSASDKAIDRLNRTQLLMTEEKIELLELQMHEMETQIADAGGEMTRAQIKKLSSKYKTLNKRNEEAQKIKGKLERGKVSALDTVSLAGYTVIDILRWDVNTPVIKGLISKCQQLKRKDVAVLYSYYMVAKLIALSIVGGILSFALLSVGIANELGTRAAIVFLVPLILCILVGYLPLDSVNNEVNKRKESIESDFPQIISKLTLLTSAGLEVAQAWNLTMRSGQGVLYDEMKLVSRDLANNVAPAEAYHRMHVKCNNKYVTKLSSAITQNISKGNSEIVRYLRELNDESWMERKHSSRRMAEKVQAKLFIPTMLMFAGILIMVVVPVMSGFNMF